MTGDDTAQPDVTGRDASPEPPDGLQATIEDVFDRLMALDGAMGTLTDAENAMVQVLEHAGAVANAYRDRPEHAEALRHLDELREIAYETLAALVRESPLAIDAAEGPPARGSSPQLVAPPRARRATLADSPHALRDAPGDAGNVTPESARGESSTVALTAETPLMPSSTLAARGDAAHTAPPTPAPMQDEDDIP